MRKGKKVKAKLRLDSNRFIMVEGKVMDNRVLFGRKEVMVDVTKASPIWLTEEKLI